MPPDDPISRKDINGVALGQLAAYQHPPAAQFRPSQDHGWIMAQENLW